jgi:hypothetical protein
MSDFFHHSEPFGKKCRPYLVTSSLFWSPETQFRIGERKTWLEKKRRYLLWSYNFMPNPIQRGPSISFPMVYNFKKSASFLNLKPKILTSFDTKILYNSNIIILLIGCFLSESLQEFSSYLKNSFPMIHEFFVFHLFKFLFPQEPV